MITVDIVGANIVIDVNGTPNNFSNATNTTIIVNAGLGNDTITVNSNGDNATTINGGDGNDSFVVGGSDYDNNLGATVRIDGDADIDILQIDDDLDGLGADVYDIS